MSSNLPPLEETEVEAEKLKKQTRRSFIGAGVAIGLTAFGIKSILGMDTERGLPWLLRRMGEMNDSFWKSTFKSSDKIAEAKPDGKPFRTNGDVGLEDSIDEKTWRLKVIDPNYNKTLEISMEEIRQLPATEMSFDFKCIEGWSQAISCKGVRASDLMTHFKIGQKPNRAAYEHAGLTSVNGGYYVSMDAKSMWHPQTLFCYEINGEALTPEHGAPLRLMTAVKYGVKSIKQIGSLQFTNTRPADYWAERGYLDDMMF